MSIGQKRVMCHMADTIIDGLNSVVQSAAVVEQELDVEKLDQVDRDTLALCKAMLNDIRSVAVSLEKIKAAKYVLENDPIYGKVLFLDFSLGKVKNEV